jgi:predicted nucleotidyltransferase
MAEMVDEQRPSEADIRARIRDDVEAALGAELDSAILVGSRARGEAREDGPWDVLIVIRDGADVLKARSAMRRLTQHLAHELNEIVSFVVTPWDAAEMDGAMLRSVSTGGRRL